MGLFNNRTTKILPGIEETPRSYAFMEIGDLVYYTHPITGRQSMGTIADIERGAKGQPVSVTLILSTGEHVTTRTNFIRY